MEKPKTKQTRILKGSSGITLIALVITIIVLLILAAVSIATLTGENGILTKADNAKTQHTQGGEKEQIQLAYDAAMTDNYANGNYGAGVTQEQLQAELQKYDEGIIVEPEGEDLKVTFPNGNVYTVKKDGTIEGPTKEEPPVALKPGDKATKTEKDNYTDGSGKKATIPEGFTVSEDDNTIDTGLVVTAPDGSEFVWVPVPYVVANSEAEAIKEEEDQIVGKAMAVKDSDDDYYRGILYNFSGTSSTVISGCTTTNFTQNTGYREPDLVTDKDTEDNLKNINLTQETFEQEMKDNYKEMIESVAKYGGFYVGRYETSLNGDENVASVKGVNPTNASDDNSQMWYGMYDKQKKYASELTIEESNKKLDTIVGSSMIWGSQYDAMLNWILKGSDASKVAKDSTSHSRTTTGKTIGDVMNKIYDLGNNLYEWTLEAGYSDGRVQRGGFYVDTNAPSHRAVRDPSDTSSQVGSRLTLYISSTDQ